MLELLSSTGLWALAALALPLAIHLWRPPPRTVRLGSLRFLESLPRRLHDLRWRERVLLAARLGLLALLALLLAAPRWLRAPAREAQRWILVDPGGSPKEGSLARLRVLRSAGYEMRALAPGFPSLTTWGKPSSIAPDVWSLLREADALLPNGSSLAVLSPGRWASLRGSRPALRHCRVEWIPTPDATDAPSFVKNGSPAPPNVLVLHDAPRADDARRLAAAIQAAGPARVQLATFDPAMGYKPDMEWIFALGTQTTSPAWTAHGANVVSETAANPADTGASWIVAVPGATAFLDPVRLWQRTPPVAPTGAVYWTDGFGQRLLTMTREGQGRHWRFCGRFDSAWTDLPRGSAFPAWLRGLMFVQDEHAPDRRLADPSQCRPAQTPASGREVTLSRAGENAVDLRGPLWTLAAAGFILERVLSHRRRSSPIVAAAPPPEPVLA